MSSVSSEEFEADGGGGGGSSSYIPKVDLGDWSLSNLRSVLTSQSDEFVNEDAQTLPGALNIGALGKFVAGVVLATVGYGYAQIIRTITRVNTRFIGGIGTSVEGFIRAIAGDTVQADIAEMFVQSSGEIESLGVLGWFVAVFEVMILCWITIYAVRRWILSG